MASKAHPGFQAEEAKLAKNPKIRNPGAVLAAGARKASSAAKRANPRLERVTGVSRPKSGDLIRHAAKRAYNA